MNSKKYENIKKSVLLQCLKRIIYDWRPSFKFMLNKNITGVDWRIEILIRLLTVNSDSILFLF